MKGLLRELLGSSTQHHLKEDASERCGQVFLIVLLVSILISFTGVFDHSLWTPDEPRDAEVGREMLVNGDYIVPTLAGKPFLEKPPLYWWVMAALYRFFGVSDGVARSTSALAGFLVLLLVFDVTRRIANPFAGLMATLVTATMGGFYGHFHKVIVDPWLALFVMLGYWAFIYSTFFTREDEEKKSSQPPALGILVFYLAGGLAFLTKGPVGPGLLFLPVFLAIVSGRRWNFFRSWLHIPGVFIFLALCLLWPLMLYLRGGRELLNGFVIENIVYRFLPPDAGGVYRGGHKQPFWYYLADFPSQFIPWVVTLPAVVHWLWFRRRPKSWNAGALLFLASVFPVGLIFLSIPGTKRELYLLPLLAPLGAVVGAWVAATVHKQYFHTIDRFTHLSMLVLLTLAFFGAFGAMTWAYCVSPSFFLRFHTVLHAKPPALLFFPLLGALLIVGAIFAVYGLRLWSQRPSATGPYCAWMALAFFVLGASLAYALADGFKNLHPMTRELQSLGAVSPNLLGYCLDETTQAIVPYDTGASPRNIIDPQELTSYIEKNPSGNLLMKEEYFSLLPSEVRSWLRSIRQWRFSKHRTYSLYEFGLTAPDKNGTNGEVQSKRD